MLQTTPNINKCVKLKTTERTNEARTRSMGGAARQNKSCDPAVKKKVKEKLKFTVTHLNISRVSFAHLLLYL